MLNCEDNLVAPSDPFTHVFYLCPNTSRSLSQGKGNLERRSAEVAHVNGILRLRVRVMQFLFVFIRGGRRLLCPSLTPFEKGFCATPRLPPPGEGAGLRLVKGSAVDQSLAAGGVVFS